MSRREWITLDLLALLLVAAANSDPLFARFTLPRWSQGCSDTTVVMDSAKVSRVLVYVINNEPERWNWNLWKQAYAFDIQPAGSQDGDTLRLVVPEVFGLPGDSMGVWVDCADSVRNWQCEPAVVRFRRKP